MAKKITVYTSTTCAYCVMVKKWLDSKGFTYETLNIDDDPSLATKLYDMTKQLIVPVTVIENEDGSQQSITGYNIGALSSALVG